MYVRRASEREKRDYSQCCVYCCEITNVPSRRKQYIAAWSDLCCWAGAELLDCQAFALSNLVYPHEHLSRVFVSARSFFQPAAEKKMENNVIKSIDLRLRHCVGTPERDEEQKYIFSR